MSQVMLEVKPRSEPRRAPTLAGCRASVPSSLEPSQKKDDSRIKPRTAARSPESGLNVSADGSCSSDSSGSRSLVKKVGFQRRRRPSGLRSGKIVPEGIDVSVLLPSPTAVPVVGKRRCTWITPNSEPVYISFHDEEWGVPVHDDRKLFELLVLSEALAELSWPAILKKRDLFRKLFDNFDPSSVAKFTEKKIHSLRSGGSILLSEQKLRAVVENARQVLKVADEFGSFSYYCWSFVNRKPVANGYRYARQVPVRTPKAEAMSKDLMQRGFRCVGPTIIYSFMQAAGIVNDHLSSCFRYQDCILSHEKECKTNAEEPEAAICKALDKACSLQT